MTKKVRILVQGIKENLSKELEGTSYDTERCLDMLQQLSNCDITMKILSKTLVGTVVSKMKSHPELGPTAKGLLKQWKKIAKAAKEEGKSSDEAKKKDKDSNSKE